MISVAFFSAKEYEKKLFDKYNEGYDYKINYLPEQLNPKTAKLAKGSDVVCVFVNDIVNREVIDILKENGVKLIALRCAGFNNVDLEAAKQSGIKVVRVPAYSPYAVAEHATTLLMSVNRKICEAHRKNKVYNFTLDGLLGFDVHGKTVGVIGTGKIGKCFISIMKGFGAEVLAYDVYEDKDAEKELGYKYVALDELYKRSDIISLHCPLTDENEYMINYDSISNMKDGVYIINTSRGKLVDTDGLLRHLKSGKVGGVGMDVYENESEFFLHDMSHSNKRDDKLSILMSLPNVMVTSHQAFFTREALDKITTDTLKNIKDIFENGSSQNEIE